MGWQDAPLATPVQPVQDKQPAWKSAPIAQQSNQPTQESQPSWKSAPALPQNTLAASVQKVESNNNPNAVNAKSGAEGAMQTLPTTLDNPGYGVRPAQNNSPEEKIRVGQDYLAALRKKYNNNDVLALAAYNWGPGNVNKLTAKLGDVAPEEFIKHLPNETQSYITKVQNAAAGILPTPSKPTPTGDTAEWLASISEPAINAGANLVSSMAAPFLSDKSLKILQDKGLYTPGESPVKEYSKAAYSTLMAPLSPAIEMVTGGAKAAAKGAGIPENVINKTGDVLNTAMDVLGVAGVPGAKRGALPAAEEVRAAKPEPVMDSKMLEQKLADLDREHAATTDPVKQEAIKKQMMDVVNEVTSKPQEPAWKSAPTQQSVIEKQMAELEKKHDATTDPEQQAKIKTQMDALVEQHPAVKANTEKSDIFTPDEGIASTKSLASVGGVADRMFAEKNRMAADQVELQKWVDQFKDVPKQTWEKFNDHMDDPKGVPLTPQEQTIFDKSIGVLEKERNNAKKVIADAGYRPDEVVEEPTSETVGGATRQVVGKGTPMDRLLGIKPGNPVSGKSLSRTAASFKPRTMKVITDENGARKVVHVKDDGTVVDASNPDVILGHASDPNALKDATQKEIEAATEGRIKYHKNSLGVQVTSLLQERRAARNIKLLKELPRAPGAEEVMRGPFTKSKNIPNGWVEVPNIAAFRGYHFEPEFAEEIQDHYNAVKRKDGLLKALESTNNFMKGAFFFLNPAHAYNVAEAFAVSKGALGFAKDFPTVASDFLKSLKSVATRDKMYIKGARAGVPYRGLDTVTDKFNKNLLTVMGERARQDPENFAQFAKEFGFNKPADLIKRVAQISHDIPFGLQDILQQTLERQLVRKGKSQAQATEEIAKTLPNYRTKARYFNQRMLGQAAKGSAFLQFPGWDIGRLSGMANILKGAAKLDLKSLDQLLMIAVLYEFGTQVIDPAVKQLTGNENAEGPTAGYGSLVKAGKDVIMGEKSPYQAAQTLFPKGYIPSVLTSGVNTYTGQPTSLPGETPKEVLYDYTKRFAEELDPIKRAANILSGKSSIKEEMLKQAGIKSPSEEEINNKYKAQKYILKELYHKRAKEPDWIQPQ